MTFRRMILSALVCAFSFSASANQITENWEVIGAKGIERLEEDCVMSRYTSVQLSILGGIGTIGFGGLASIASGSAGTAGVGSAPAIILGATALATTGAFALSVAYTGDKHEFMAFIEDLQSGIDSPRVEKFRALARASGVSFEYALRKLNEMVRSQNYCASETTLKTLENLL